jgi:hypothetical protein
VIDAGPALSRKAMHGRPQAKGGSTAFIWFSAAARHSPLHTLLHIAVMVLARSGCENLRLCTIAELLGSSSWNHSNGKYSPLLIPHPHLPDELHATHSPMMRTW